VGLSIEGDLGWWRVELSRELGKLPSEPRLRKAVVGRRRGAMSRAEVNSVTFAGADEVERAAVAPAICGSTLEMNVLGACEEEFRPVDRIPGLVVAVRTSGEHERHSRSLCHKNIV
jgi:hypothetical protein